MRAEDEDTEFRFFVLDPGSEVLAAAPIYRDMSSDAERLRSLARALAASPGFAGLDHALLVVRQDEPAKVGLLGRFSPAEVSRIESLAGIIDLGLRRLRYVSYQEAEQAARSLASRLRDQLGRETLNRCRFLAMPRGGIFVLGMLSYLLDLRAEQIEPNMTGSFARQASKSAAETPLILVDDCALSGLRFAECLDRVDASRVVFAHLFSHPALREAITREESRVVACIAGDDLRDKSDELPGEEPSAREDRWRQRSDQRFYWLGFPEHICFAWNEPDITIWNAADAREEAPWRIVPPEFCLKNRPARTGNAEVQVQERARGAIQPGRSTLYARLEDKIVVGEAESGRAYSFREVAASIWTSLVEVGDVNRVVTRLAAEYDVPPARLREDVESMLQQCLRLGLLQRTDVDAVVE